MIELCLHGAPLGKERVRLQRAQGRLYTPERTLSYEARLAAEGQRIMGDRPLLVGPLAIEIMAHAVIPKSKPKRFILDAIASVIYPTGKPDLDNIAKIVCDGLNLVIWRDDAEIVDLTIRKRYSERPRVELRVWEIRNQGVFA